MHLLAVMLFIFITAWFTVMAFFNIVQRCWVRLVYCIIMAGVAWEIVRTLT